MPLPEQLLRTGEDADGGSKTEAIAALLHHAIEDAGQSHATVSERFGAQGGDIVRDCADTLAPVAAGE